MTTMVDFHKEIKVSNGNCDHLQKLLENEHKISSLKEDVYEIKTQIQSMCTQITEVAKTMQTVVLKLDERDKHSQENAMTNKQTFERFGTKIDNLEKSNQSLEIKLVQQATLENKITKLENVVYWAGSGFVVICFTVMGWMAQKLIG